MQALKETLSSQSRQLTELRAAYDGSVASAEMRARGAMDEVTQLSTQVHMVDNRLVMIILTISVILSGARIEGFATGEGGREGQAGV